MRPVELDFDNCLIRQIRVVNHTPHFHGITGQDSTVNKFYRTICGFHSSNKSLLYPVFPFDGRHFALLAPVTHPVSQRDTEPGQVFIFINHLGHRLTSVFFYQLRSIVVNICAVSFSKFRGDNYIPVHQVGFQATNFGHAE